MRRALITLGLMGLIAGSAAGASVVAMQDFESPQHFVTIGGIEQDLTATSDLGVVLGTYFDGAGLGWTASLLNASSDGVGGDMVGVVYDGHGGNPQLTGASNITGQWFNVSDPDGTLALTFDPINAAGYTGLELSFTWATNPSDFEPADIFDVSVNGTSVFNRSGDAIDDNTHTAAQVDNFTLQTLDLSAYDGQTLNIVFSATSDNNNEQFGIDNVTVTGTRIVPLPAAAWTGLMLLATLAAARLAKVKTNR